MKIELRFRERGIMSGRPYEDLTITIEGKPDVVLKLAELVRKSLDPSDWEEI